METPKNHAPSEHGQSGEALQRCEITKTPDGWVGHLVTIGRLNETLDRVLIAKASSLKECSALVRAHAIPSASWKVDGAGVEAVDRGKLDGGHGLTVDIAKPDSARVSESEAARNLAHDSPLSKQVVGATGLAPIVAVSRGDFNSILGVLDFAGHLQPVTMLGAEGSEVGFQIERGYNPDVPDLFPRMCRVLHALLKEISATGNPDPDTVTIRADDKAVVVCEYCGEAKIEGTRCVGPLIHGMLSGVLADVMKTGEVRHG
jgi:hypothetical protein